ncbi:MAG: hypothetical protein PHU25_08185 [Deltaproteobacteria bacterium]|nr:hypothetical protein [Deltaproteobacteria bacterium]
MRTFRTDMAVMVLALSVAPVAAAQETQSKGDEPPRLVMVASEQDTGEVEKTFAAIRAQMSDMNVNLTLTRVPVFFGTLREQYETVRQVAERSRARLTFWIDLSVEDRVFLYIAEPGGGRVLVRAVEPETDETLGRVDVIAIIVRTVAEAIIEGGEIGVTRPQPEAARPPPSPPPKPPVLPPDSGPKRREKPQPSAPRDLLEIAGAYVGSLYDKEPTWRSGASVGLAGRVSERFWVKAAYRIEAPIRKANDLVSVEFSPHPFEVGAFLRLGPSKVAVDLGIALVNDPLTWSLRTKDVSVRPERNRFRWLVAACPSVTVGWAPYGIYRFFLTVSADIYFNESPSVVEASERDVKVIDPLDVRPTVLAGVAFVIF